MNQFQYVRASETAAALKAISKSSSTKFVAGGTNLIDLMKCGVEDPHTLVDINHLPLKAITHQNGVLHIGALALNSEVAENSMVKQRFPLLAMALNQGASPQLRNMATVGGNMLQRTRCPYFFDTSMPCNKRVPGSGCGALQGFNRMHAIFGASDQCIAVHPSDMCVALAALDATVNISSIRGNRKVAFNDFHRLPGEHPQFDTVLQKGELITGIDIPDSPFDQHAYYLKVRDRASYAFALVSVAAGLNIKNNTIQEARLAMGGVAHKPWRLFDAEKSLVGKPVSVETFQHAAEVAMQGAKAYEFNRFKLKLAPNSIVQALKTASGLTA